MIFLASASPRRAELLAQIGIQFEVTPAHIDETAQPGEVIEDLVQRLCREKAVAVRAKLDEMKSGDLVLAADTLIGLDGEIIGKPESREHCAQILARLSGREHQAYSAVALVNHDGRVNSKVSLNRIKFRSVKAHEIRYYCQTDEPMDKAGAYAIQGLAAIFIEQLSGSYSSVMGLPLFETAELLAVAGQPITTIKSP